jgi:hypothetical protein
MQNFSEFESYVEVLKKKDGTLYKTDIIFTIGIVFFIENIICSCENNEIREYAFKILISIIKTEKGCNNKNEIIIQCIKDNENNFPTVLDFISIKKENNLIENLYNDIQTRSKPNQTSYSNFILINKAIMFLKKLM